MSETGKSSTAEDPSQRQQWERDCEEYKAQRQTYTIAYVEAEKAYDTWLLTLSGGALGLSMTFLKDIARSTPGTPVTAAWWLFVSWIAFGLSIILILVNQRISPGAHERFIEILDEQFSPPRYQADGQAMQRVHAQQRNALQSKVILVFNWASVFFFCVGVVILGLFIRWNMH